MLGHIFDTKAILIYICLFGFHSLAAPGIFSNNDCKIHLMILRGGRGEIYIEEGMKLGYEGEELNEYIERRLRARYLVEKTKQAREDQNALQQIFDALPPNLFRDETVSRRKELIQEEVERFARQETSYGGTQEQNNPVPIAILRSKPPQNLQQKENLEDILLTRSGMWLHRAELSRRFVKDVPPTSRVDEISSARRQNVYQLTEKDFERKHANTPLGVFWEKDPDMDRVNFDDIEKRLLASDSVPEVLKDEISMENDFRHKYGFERSPFFKNFLLSVNEYYPKPKP